MSDITTRRQPNGQHAVLLAGVPVGACWRWPSGSGFGLRIDGVYWRGGVPDTRGGFTTTSVRRLKDAPTLAARALQAKERA